MASIRRHIVPGLAALALSLPACTDQSPGLAGCTGQVSVSVTGGTQPTFTWSPGCAVEGLIVSLPGPGLVVWSIEDSAQANTIMPPVTFGQALAGVRVLTGPLPLRPGIGYDLTLLRYDSANGGAVLAAGETGFTP